MTGEPRVIVLATSNRGKLAEFAALVREFPVRLVCLEDVAGRTDIPEPYATFHENAAHKALIAARLSGGWSLAEDSGLEVDALARRPGVYSARFAGRAASDDERVALLLRLLQGVPSDRRTARFRAAFALAGPGRLLGRWTGECPGRVTASPRGEGGFGYDPVFVADGMERTNAELTTEQKNRISHRGRAARCFIADLPLLLGT